MGAILEAAYHRNVLLWRDVSCSCSVALLHYSWSHSYSKSKFVTKDSCFQFMVYCHRITWIDEKTTLVGKFPLSSIILIIMFRRNSKEFSERNNI